MWMGRQPTYGRGLRLKEPRSLSFRQNYSNLELLLYRLLGERKKFLFCLSQCCLVSLFQQHTCILISGGARKSEWGIRKILVVMISRELRQGPYEEGDHLATQTFSKMLNVTKSYLACGLLQEF